MTLQPINFNIRGAPQITPPVSRAVVGIVGSSTGSAGNHMPVAVNNLPSALVAFGAGTIYDFCVEAFKQVNLWIVGVAFDSTNSTPAARTASLVEAIAALRTSALTGYKPNVLIAPRETYVSATSGAASAGASALKSLAEPMRAIVIADATPSTVALATAWNVANGGPRTLAIAQSIGTPEIPLTITSGAFNLESGLPGSSFLAAALARNDSLYGVFDSFSNREVIGAVNVVPVRSFEYTDPTATALILRTSRISSIVRDLEGTWLTVGGTMKHPDPSSPFRYVGVQRSVDAIEAHVIILAKRRWNRNQRSNFIPDLLSEVQNYLDLLVNGGILASALAVSGAQNTEAARSAGLAYVSLTLNFPAINEQINFDVEASLV